MNPNHPTLIAAAIAAALAAGGASAQGSASSPPGSAPGSGGSAASTPTTPSGTAASPSRTGSPSARAAEVSSADRRFVTEAAQAGMAEIRASQVAATQANDPQVRDYAQKMVDEHTRANAELMKLASARNITPPEGPSKAHQSSLEKLQKSSGADFDRAYMKMQVDDHQKAISLYERQAKNGKDPELKAFAQQTLTHLREHLKRARSEMRGSDAASGARSSPSAGMSGTQTPGSAATTGSTRQTDSTAASGSRGGGTDGSATGVRSGSGTGSGTGSSTGGSGAAAGGAAGSDSGAVPGRSSGSR